MSELQRVRPLPVVGVRGDTVAARVRFDLGALVFGVLIGDAGIELKAITLNGRPLPHVLIALEGGTRFVGIPSAFAAAGSVLELQLACKRPVSDGVEVLMWFDREAAHWLDRARFQMGKAVGS